MFLVNIFKILIRYYLTFYLEFPLCLINYQKYVAFVSYNIVFDRYPSIITALSINRFYIYWTNIVHNLIILSYLVGTS